jgi:hypothetical protein
MHFESFTTITFTLIIAYILEGLAITAAIYLISKKSLSLSKLSMIFSSITGTIVLLDILAPKIGTGARHGYGFGTGFNLIGGDRASSLEVNNNKVPSVLSDLNSYNDLDKFSGI